MDPNHDPGPTGDRRLVVEVDLDRAPGSGGVVWHLPHDTDPDGQLDANLVRLEPGERIGEHRNHEVDVLVVVRSGSGVLEIDGVAHSLGDSDLALVPRRCRRSIVAGSEGIVYLTVHVRRGALTIDPPTG